ncbi:hypothetical protein LTR27_004448 [Elasticomyces elasticus]|nr:hypothetical protein LTR27_004448 [Elasticomyces elasticus]
MAATKIIDIAPQGDVLLLCSQTAENMKIIGAQASRQHNGFYHFPSHSVEYGKIVGLRVSSHIMSYASPVFKAMLEPRFREGLTLAAESTVEIPLDDNLEDMRMICNIFHMRQDKVPQGLSAGEILRCAELCDKYNCAIAMQPFFRAWIGLCVRRIARVGELVNCLIAASLLNYKPLLEIIGVQLVLMADTSINKIVEPQTEKLTAICAELDKHRGGILASIPELFEEVINVLVKANVDGHEGCDMDCKVPMMRLKLFLVELSKSNLWPTKTRSPVLATTIACMTNFYVRDSKDLTSCNDCCIMNEEVEEEMGEEVELGPWNLETISSQITSAGQTLRSEVNGLRITAA